MAATDADHLYGLPPDEFTAARDELAKKLRKRGHGDEAAAVKALKKPNLPAWAINQLARRHRADVKKLLDAGAELRKAHENLLSGGKQEDLRKAAERERRLVTALVERTEPLLSEAGKPSPANLERVRNTLHAAATDDEVREELEAGRLVRDRESVGLGPFAAAAPEKADRKADAKRREVREARAGADRAAKALRSAEAALERAKEDAERANRQLQDRQRSLEAARRDADEAERALRDAEER